jgi:predicted membrane protein
VYVLQATYLKPMKEQNASSTMVTLSLSPPSSDVAPTRPATLSIVVNVLCYSRSIIMGPYFIDFSNKLLDCDTMVRTIGMVLAKDSRRTPFDFQKI